LAKEKSEKKEGIDYKAYSKILGKLELKEIYLESCSVSHNREDILKQKNLKVAVKDKASHIQQENKLIVTHKYDLNVKTPETKRGFALKISICFVLIFHTEVSISKDFFDVFQKINLPLNSWPYFREFVQNMTQRMNIPPLTLPFVKRG
jgi:preprotein translocase subunit SecB